jgi:hypothetical protein
MRNRALIFVGSWLAYLVCLTSCRNNQVEEIETIHVVVPVTVTSPRLGSMTEYTEMLATSAFLVRTVIRSTITGYVEKCSFTPGDKVVKDQVLFQLCTREAAALQNDSVNTLKINGTVILKAPMNGVAATIDHPLGDFVQEGDGLCVLVDPRSLVFLLELPFERNGLLSKGDNLRLILPDQTKLDATVRSVLPSLSGPSQTQRVVLQPKSVNDAPENLTAKVRVMTRFKPKAWILPKSCILNDEVMKNFWVMKLINDSIAVRVPVEPGISGTDSLEVISNALSTSDRILTSGNYGVADTLLVRIIRHP